MIIVDNVSVTYRIAKEKRTSFQQYIINFLKGKRLNYESFNALKNISFEVKRGESIGIIGHNGAGKSTLLKVIARVLKPISGKIIVNGRIAPLIELGAGFDPELTGKENIYLNASILGFSKKEIDKKFQRIVDFSELGSFIHSPLKSYSSGMISRLGFSIATEVEPDVLIVDEVLSVGDEHFRKKCDKRIMDFKNSGVTILLVSHNIEDIKRLCNKVLWLHHGVQKMWGDPESVTKEYLKEMSKF